MIITAETQNINKCALPTACLPAHGMVRQTAGGFLLLQICLLAEERVNSEGRLGWGEGNPGE